GQLVGRLIINTDVELVAVEYSVAAFRKVVGETWQLGSRKLIQQGHSLGRQTAGRNAIVRADLRADREGAKWGSSGSVGCSGGGIINLHGIFAEITDRAARVTTGGTN